MEEPRFLLWLIGVFSAIATGLTAVGLYGLVTESVVMRSKELGVRLALGASAQSLVGAVMYRTAKHLALAIAGGCILAPIAARSLSTQLYGVSYGDPKSYSVAVLFVLGIAALAAYLPARRVASMDPSAALRQD
jgi:putative ABC transport system permease protein